MAVTYLVMETSEERYKRLIAFKTHVALLKPQTTPRLELLSALLLSRLLSSVTYALEGELTLVSLTVSPTQWWHYFGSKEWKKVKPFVQIHV